jgi:hypothetical protein
MHAASLTPHAQKIFWATSKSETHIQHSNGMQKSLKCMRCQWHRMLGACHVIDTTCKMHAVSLILHAHVHAVSLIPHAHYMRCQWYRKHDAFCVIDTACKIWHRMHMCMRCHWYRMHITCGVNDTASTMHSVSLTPHAKYDTACTIDERFERPWQPLKAISINNIYVPELSYPTTKKMFMNEVSLTPHFCVRKSIISRRIRCRIQKGFSSWIRGPGGIVWFKKTEGQKSRDTVPLTLH